MQSCKTGLMSTENNLISHCLLTPSWRYRHENKHQQRKERKKNTNIYVLSNTYRETWMPKFRNLKKKTLKIHMLADNWLQFKVLLGKKIQWMLMQSTVQLCAEKTFTKLNHWTFQKMLDFHWVIEWEILTMFCTLSLFQNCIIKKRHQTRLLHCIFLECMAKHYTNYTTIIYTCAYFLISTLIFKPLLF